MRKPSIMDDLLEIKKEWRDPDYRRGFIAAFIPALLKNFLLCGALGLIGGYALASLL